MPLDQRHVAEPEFTQHNRLFSDLGNLLVNNAVGFCSSSVYFGNSLLQLSGVKDEAVCSSQENTNSFYSKFHIQAEQVIAVSISKDP